MSGHSKWSTIKRAKGVTDARRSQTFTKIANAITIATKLGGSGDPNANPRVRLSLDQARAANMPKDNIQRAIDRGLGKLGGQSLEEVLYEGFGPGRVAVVIEGVTDNRIRTNQLVRNILERGGGSMAGQGAVSYMFDRVGEIHVASKGGQKDDEILELIDLGAEDVEDYEDEKQMYSVYTQNSELNTVSNKITQAGYEVVEAGLVYKPNLLTEVSDQETAEKVIGVIERLEELDDVQKVYANADIPQELING
jgi:YebC/PmpR family DNA-binding regulatory protein